MWRKMLPFLGFFKDEKLKSNQNIYLVRVDYISMKIDIILYLIKKKILMFLAMMIIIKMKFMFNFHFKLSQFIRWFSMWVIIL